MATALICMNCGTRRLGQRTYRDQPACDQCGGDNLVEFGPERMTLKEAEETLADFARTVGGSDYAGHIGVVSSFNDPVARAMAEAAVLALYQAPERPAPVFAHGRRRKELPKRRHPGCAARGVKPQDASDEDTTRLIKLEWRRIWKASWTIEGEPHLRAQVDPPTGNPEELSAAEAERYLATLKAMPTVPDGPRRPWSELKKIFD